MSKRKDKDPKQDYRDVLAQLKENMIRSEALDLISKDELIKSAEHCATINPEQFSEEEREKIALSIYRASYRYQISKQISKAVESLNLGLKYSKDKNLIYLIKEKLKLIHQTNSVSTCSEIEKEIIAICEKFNSDSSPFEIIKQRKPEFFIQPIAPFYLDHFSTFTSLGVYRWRGDFDASNYFSKLLRQFKLGSELYVDFMSFLAGQYFVDNPKLLDCVDLIVPVPADPSRELQRGYDLALKLSSAISCKLAIPFKNILGRKSNCPPSKFCSYSELKEQYYVNKSQKINLTTLNVLVVDDIVTKGSTVSVCAELLKNLGASEFHCFCLAKSESTLKSSKYI